MSRPDKLDKRSFEELIELLDQSLKKLEDERLTLEDSIAEYEMAVEIASLATEQLENATLRVTEISARLEFKRDSNPGASDADLEW